MIHLLKLFLPSWNFFNDIGPVPELEMQMLSQGRAATGWRPAFESRTTNGWFRVLWNPAGNAELLEKSLVERAAQDLEGFRDPADWIRSDWGATLTRLARTRLVRPPDVNAEGFRFRLVTRERAAPETVLFVSPEIAVQPC